jgi:molybdopterin-containing oxidoreductase family iron-sulfur binding subunit
MNRAPREPSRRNLLGAGAAVAAAAAAGLALAPGVSLIELAKAHPADATASGPVRWGLLVDANRCSSGCQECVSACERENGLESDIDRRQRPQWIRKVELEDISSKRAVSLPVMCQHCAEPPCVDVCPTGASFKRADGLVLVDRHSCIGCRYCVMACPYKARSFVHEPLTGQSPQVPRGKGCVEGCTLCVQRIDRGAQPACVQACSESGHAALVFGDLNDPSSEIAQRTRAAATVALRADLRLDPGVRYLGV